MPKVFRPLLTIPVRPVPKSKFSKTIDAISRCVSLLANSPNSRSFENHEDPVLLVKDFLSFEMFQLSENYFENNTARIVTTDAKR